jgi:phosphatidate cytidylyltransferase
MSAAAKNNTPPAPSSKGKVFLSRLLSTVVLWAVILGGLFSGYPLLSNRIFLVIMLLLSVVGLLEFFGMMRQRGLACFSRWGLAGGVLLVVGVFVYLNGFLGGDKTVGGVNDFETGFLVLFVLGLCLRQLWARRNPDGIQAVAVTLFGLMYVGYLLNFIQKINYFPGINGTVYLLYFIMITKFSDTGAYLVGSLLGRHKMIPRISPGKTWEGFAGAILVPVLISLVFAHLAQDYLLGMTWYHAAVLGVLLSLGAVVGDLIESLFKRECGVKDSGAYFPGIGGILDLIDSLLFNGPIMYLYLRYVLDLG